MRIHFSCLLVFAVTASPVAMSAPYEKYANARYGFSVSRPSSMKMDTPPANGDGRHFSDIKGFSIVASGINNVANNSLAAEAQSLKSEFDVVTYKAMGKSWVVMSGRKSSEIIYVKAYVGPQSINYLWITYPASMAADAMAIVSKVSGSFKPGNLNELH